MSSNKQMITGFMTVFEGKLDKLIVRIKAEYEKPKSERNKEGLKKLAREAKDLRKLIKQCRTQEGSQSTCCPSCGCEFEIKEIKNGL